MKAFFNALTTIALRFRLVTLSFVVLLLWLGVVAVSDLNQELLPPIDLPQTIILAQASGMTGEQVLNVFTERIEPELSDLTDIINIESTSGSFGTVITAFNDFGLNQERLRAEIGTALDAIWFPQREITPTDGQSPDVFAQQLLGELESDVLLYLALSDSNFLFQLSPEVWSAFSDTAIEDAVIFLANQSDQSASNASALQRLVDKEVVPQLNTIAEVANVTISGGQVLPGEEGAFAVDPEALEDVTASADSLLLRLSPEVGQIIVDRVDAVEAIDESTVEILREQAISIPESVPDLPETWRQSHFSDASDLIEIASLTTPLSDIFNDFYITGTIRGALGQTDDLTPEMVTRLLEIEPTLVNAFDAEHLTAMSPDVFAVLPSDYVANLDGFTRDALAAASLSESITGEIAERQPIDLPGSWRIQSPEIITFSFADIPLATFSVASTGELDAATTDDAMSEQPDENPVQDSVSSDDDAVENNPFEDVPEGPSLPPIFALIGSGFGAELDTADDLLSIELPEEFAALVGSSTVGAADLLNLLTLPTPDPETLPEGVEVPSIPLDPAVIVQSIPADAYAFIAEYDESFISSLSPAVFELLPEEVLSLPGFAPPLADVWNVLAQQPQFTEMPLQTAADVIAIGDGSATDILEIINSNVPDGFEGYEVRLFDSLTPSVIRYFAINEEGFYQNLDDEVLLKFSRETLSVLPEDFIESLDEAVLTQIEAIVSGQEDSAFTVLEAELYTTDIVPADPSAPMLNSEWQTIAGFIQGVREFNNAFDLFRFSDAIGTPAEFVNSLFESANGRGFVPNLLGNMPLEAFTYVAENDPDFVNDLVSDAVLLLSDEVKATLPDDVIDRAEAGGETFTPTNQVTRTNNQPSLLVTVFKTQEANTVSTYADVEAAMNTIDEENDSIIVGVAFEQSSFVEDSISGVAREGGLGAVFAVIIILVFLSGGVWSRGPRRIVALIMIGVFAALSVAIVVFEFNDIVIQVLIGFGLFAGLLVLIWPQDLPDPAWRATLVIAVSIPLSILTAFVGMRWFSPTMHELITPLAESNEFFNFALRLFPDDLTLNIMTLSGLTVAVGRVVDDSIVVLENIFRQLQSGMDKREAILVATRDVSSAIFVATMVAVVVFLPLGLTGGIIGAFFLPFGLAVTYALLGSFIVAVTVVPVLAELFLSVDDLPEESDIWVANFYIPVLRWSLSSGGTKSLVLLFAFVSLVFSMLLFGQRPVTFLPNFGEPQVTVLVDLPGNVRIQETNALVSELEQFVVNEVPEEQLGTIQTVIGGSGLSFEALITGGSVAENQASLTIGVDVSADELDQWTQVIREESNRIFGQENVVVSAASVSDGGFGGFALVVSGLPEDLDERIAIDQRIIDTLNAIEGIANVSSNLSESLEGAADAESQTFIRVNLESAISYSAELETENTIGVTQQAIQAVENLTDLPDTINVSQGFESELQTEGIASLILAIGIASIIVVVILIVTFSSPVYWIAIFLSVIVAPVGAAIALTVTDRVLGISALIGILMLLGLVITNAVVLIDRVRSNRSERGMVLYDALLEAGGRRLRPILMTSLATIIALMPLTIGLSDGAIIASELGTVVVGGVFSSTILTLVVVPVMYSILYPVHRFLARLIGVEAD